MSATFDRILLYLVGGSLRIARSVDDPPALTALLRKLGFDVPNGFALSEIGDAIGVVLGVFEEFRRTPDLEQLSIAQITRAAGAVGEITLAVGRLSEVVNAQLPQGFLIASGIAERLPKRMLDWLVTEELLESRPTVYHAARLAGLIEVHDRAADATIFQPEFTERIVHWDQIGALFTDPVGGFRDRYGWGQATFDADSVLEIARDMLRSLNVPADLIPPGPGAQPTLQIPLLSQNQDEMLLALTVSAAPPLTPSGGLGLQTTLEWMTNVSAEIEIEPGLTVAVQFGSSASGRFDVSMHPETSPQIALTSGPSNAGVGRFAIDIMRTGRPLTLLTVSRALRIECMGIRWAGGVETKASGDAEVFIEVGIQDGRLMISAAEGDGFLKSLLPAESKTLLFEVTLGVGSKRGFYMKGNGGLETALSIHETIGFVSIETLYLKIHGSDEGLALNATVSGSAQLGPIAASVDRVGLEFLLGFRPGNLGNVDLSIAFKPPTGLGLSIDAGPVTGGGYIAFDREAGRYSGVIELEMFGVGVTAIGLLETKDSSGQPLPPPGFSFLMIISARFEALQLGFGFTLNAVGGLVGIHRAMNLERLRAGVRDGSLNHVLFPDDPVRNMPQIISDLNAFYPQTRDRFVFGPMAEIGWGTPTLFRAKLGLILEVPAPVYIALLGQLDVALPTEDADIVSLHVSILGVVDFSKKLLSIDASLYDSRVALFAVSGDMAMRLSWGDPPSFALSIGGLNPHFQPPPGFPTLRRVKVSLGLDDNPRISLQGYMAVTSNSIQFGAQAEVYAAAGPFNVYGWLKFDALVIFSPFSFIFEFSVGFALRWEQEVLGGISVSGVLSGPTPFHIRGEAILTILFFDICIGFDVTLGERQDVELPEKNPWPLLEAAIQDSQNWNPELMDVRSSVRLKEQKDPNLLIVHPMGSVTFRQKVLPLNSQLDKFGEFQIIGAKRFDVRGVRLGMQPATAEFVPEFVKGFFAPGQFSELSNSQKLSRKSFESMDAGVSVSSTRVAFGRPESARIADLTYETTIIDDRRKPSRPFGTYNLSQTTQVALSGRCAKAYSPLRSAGSDRFADAMPEKLFAFDDEDYAIASTDDRGLRLEFGSGLSKTIAFQILEAHLADHPEDRDYLQVVPLAELEVQR